jgi:branched-chain amino acid transport system permease protein
MAFQPEVQWIIYGVLMVLVVFFLPQGIVPAIARYIPVRKRPPDADALPAAPAQAPQP